MAGLIGSVGGEQFEEAGSPLGGWGKSGVVQVVPSLGA